jgi:hypothetical protein
MLHPDSQSLTITATNGTLLVLQPPCHITQAFDPKQPPSTLPAAHSFGAIWDTGASISVISQNVVAACGLTSIGPAITHGVGGVHNTETYLVNLMLPNGVNFIGVSVIRGDMHGIDVLIGMDVITSGDFVITNRGGNTVFSFRVPSEWRIDFVQEHHMNKLKQQKTHGVKHQNKPKKVK